VARVGYSSSSSVSKKKKEKRGKNVLSAHLRGLFAATQVSNDFYRKNSRVKRRG